MLPNFARLWSKRELAHQVVTKQAMRLRGNSICNVPSEAAILIPRSLGYRSLGSANVHGILVVAGPSSRQTPSRVCVGARMPRATEALELVTSDIPSG